MTDAPAVETRDLGKRYRIRGRTEDLWSLRGLGMTIARGEVVGIIGPNGSGKSTLLQLLAGVVPPSEGEARLRGRIAALLELGSGFHPDFNGRENLALNASLLGLERDAVRARLPEIEAFSGLGDALDRPVRTYSSGMVLRLAFSAAAHVDADVLLLDEALAVGDMAFQFRCLGRLDDLLARNVTVVLVSHDLQLVKAYCRRALYLRHGRLAFDGESDAAVELYSRDMRDEAGRELRRPVTERPPVASGQGIRFGNGLGRILDVTLRVEGEERAVLRLRERATVDVRVHVEPSVSRPSLTLVLRDSRGYNLCVLDSNDSVIRPDERGEIRGRFELECLLEPGDFVLSLKLEGEVDTSRSELLDKQNEAVVFRVVSKERHRGGVIDLHGSFSPLEPGP